MNTFIRKYICMFMLFLTAALVASGATAQEDQPDADQTAQQLIQQAYEAANGADTFDEYNHVVNLCEAALAKEPNDAGRKYLMQLSAWALNRRGKELSKQAAETDDATTIETLEAQAMADFQESIRREPNKWQAIHNRGVSYALLGEFDKALADFDRTIQLNPMYANAWFNRGEIRYENGDFGKAVSDYTTTIKLKADDLGAHSARAHAYYQLGRYQSAITDFTRAVELAPDDAVVRADRADVYANLGYWQQAARDYRDAVKLDDKFGRAYMGAAWIMATCPDEQFRDAELAVQSAEKAIEIDGEEDWRYLDTLAAAQASGGQFEAAQATIKKAIEKSAQDQTNSLTARLNLYAEGKPFRDTARTASGNRGANR